MRPRIVHFCAPDLSISDIAFLLMDLFLPPSFIFVFIIVATVTILLGEKCLYPDKRRNGLIYDASFSVVYMC